MSKSNGKKSHKHPHPTPSTHETVQQRHAQQEGELINLLCGANYWAASSPEAAKTAAYAAMKLEKHRDDQVYPRDNVYLKELIIQLREQIKSRKFWAATPGNEAYFNTIIKCLLFRFIHVLTTAS